MNGMVLYKCKNNKHFFILGIGRTGVLILMESALYLIEANQPVYPLDLTRIMRDQRASMIQTPAQYRFVCQAILKVFQEGHIKPLPEFASSPSQSVKSDSCGKNVVVCKSVISSSSASNHSEGSEVITNGNEAKDGTLDKCCATVTASTVVLDDSEPTTTLNVLPVMVGHVEESPRPESPSSQESSSAAAPLSTAS